MTDGPGSEAPEAGAPAPTLLPLEPALRPSLMRLWARYFGSWSAEGLERRFRWQFDANPFARERAPRHLLLADGPEVVGYLGALPVPLRIRGERQVALCASGLVLDEAHRIQALRLVRALLKEPPVLATAMSDGARKLFTAAGVKLVPLSEERFRLPLRYDGSLCLRLRRRAPGPRLAGAVRPWMLGPMGKVVRPRGMPPVRALPPLGASAPVEPLDAFGADYEALWERVREGFDCSLDKTAEYMQWRYAECPTSGFLAFGLRDARGRLAALAVGVVWAERDPWGRPIEHHGEIVELMAESPADPGVRELVLRLLHALDARRVDSISALGLAPAYHPLLREIGFASESAPAAAMGVSLGRGAATADVVDAPTRWYVSAGDGEGLFALSV